MAGSPVTVDELVREVGIRDRTSLRKRCSDNHIRSISKFLADWRVVATELKLDEAEIDAIEQEGKGEAEKRWRTLTKWKAKYSFKATYRRLVKALLLVGRADHAESVCRMLTGEQNDSSSTSDSATPSENSSEESESPMTLAATQDSDLPGATLSVHIGKRNRVQMMPRHQAPKKKRKLQHEIDNLDRDFRNLARQAQRKLKVINVDLDDFKLHINQLPVSIRQLHIKFFSGNLTAINGSKDVAEIFRILGQYWDFLNYSLLQHIIDEFGDEELKKDMRKYLKQLRQFRNQTTIRQFMQNWDRDLPPCNSELIISMPEYWMDHTLEDLEQFIRRLSCQGALATYSTSLIKGKAGSIVLSLGLHCSFPISELVHLCQSMSTRHLLRTHGVLKIQFKNVCIYDFEFGKMHQNKVEIERSEKEMERNEKRVLQWQLAELERQLKYSQQERGKEKREFLIVLEQRDAQLKYERRDGETLQQHYKEYHQLRMKELQQEMHTMAKDKDERMQELQQEMHTMAKEKDERMQELQQEMHTMAKEKDERMQELQQEMHTMAREKDERIQELQQEMHTMAKEKDERIQELEWHLKEKENKAEADSEISGQLEVQLQGVLEELLHAQAERDELKLLQTWGISAVQKRRRITHSPLSKLWHSMPPSMAREKPMASDSRLDTLSQVEEEALRIPQDDLDDFEQIGEGQFGKVFKATLKRGPGGGIPVAMKTTKKSSSEADKASLLRNMNIMSQMVHPNIVRLYGLITEDVPSPWIVMEYLPHGDLKNFLKKNQRPVQQLVKYMIDVAMGMQYISERGLVHRDLAARNILVGENELCKVAEFNLLRELPKDESIYYSQITEPCPIRWMPPEALTERAFSPASDVWSFGILMWEMFNPNKLPYDKFSDLECITKVIQGYRMPVPRGCPSTVARIMRACWHQNPTKRPSFLHLSTLLSTKVTFNE